MGRRLGGPRPRQGEKKRVFQTFFSRLRGPVAPLRTWQAPRARALQKLLAKHFPQPRETMNLGDEHMTDETREVYRAKVAERQAKEDALVQKRIEAASDYVGTRVATNR